MLATFKGLLKTSKDQLINHYYKGEFVTCICHLKDSIYLLGFNKDKLRVWNQETEQEMYLISEDRLYSIKRVLSTEYFILKTDNNGLKLLTVNDLGSNQFTIQDFLEAKDEGNYTDSLQV